MEEKSKPCHHPTLLQRYYLVFLSRLLKPTGTAFNFFWTFFYNRFWIKDRVFKDGWLPADEESRSLLKKTFPNMP